MRGGHTRRCERLPQMRNSPERRADRPGIRTAERADAGSDSRHAGAFCAASAPGVCGILAAGDCLLDGYDFHFPRFRVDCSFLSIFFSKIFRYHHGFTELAAATYAGWICDYPYGELDLLHLV